MMNRPLLISGILEHGAAQFGEQDIVSRETHGPLHRYTYADAAQRARQLAHALAQMGLKAGSAVGADISRRHTTAASTRRWVNREQAMSLMTICLGWKRAGSAEYASLCGVRARFFFGAIFSASFAQFGAGSGRLLRVQLQCLGAAVPRHRPDAPAQPTPISPLECA
jgi:hypothetical protein